jgi:CxxC motif-containing protein (DUF1111 family)
MPLGGLTAPQLERFRAGAAMFDRRFAPEDGLGPLFNQDRCSSCHDLPALGGTGVELVVKATRWVPPATCDILASEGGDNFQTHATPALAALGVKREFVPPSANGLTRLVPPALFGLGLMDAIPEAALEALADPDDRNGDGVSGRLGRTTDGRVGRFGQKADVATLVEFVDAALRTELGLTTMLHPAEETINGRPIPPAADPVPDPEVDSTLWLLADFVRFLAAPAPAIPSSKAERDSIRRGEGIFRRVGCPACHVRELRTGPSADPAFDRQPVPLYSDMLLHDLGPGLADICAPGATPSELRTARLAGVRFRLALLHDGRASTFSEAILAHAGEAAASRDAFGRLGPGEQAYLVKFLSVQ